MPLIPVKNNRSWVIILALERDATFETDKTVFNEKISILGFRIPSLHKIIQYIRSLSEKQDVPSTSPIRENLYRTANQLQRTKSLWESFLIQQCLRQLRKTCWKCGFGQWSLAAVQFHFLNACFTCFVINSAYFLQFTDFLVSHINCSPAGTWLIYWWE